jgi:DNA-binding transcriptional regulator YhcF (GntR family)
MAQLAATLELERTIDRDGELPVGVQLLWRLRALIRGGSLAPGDQLPSVRELAQRCDVNVNTIRSAYAQLEDEALIVRRQGAGTFVADEVPAQPALDQLAAQAIAEAHSSGVEARELASAIYLAASSPAEAAASPQLPALVESDGDTLAARRELRRQIARLEARLAAFADPSPNQAVLPTPAPAQRPGAMPRVASLAELERVRDRLLDELKRAGAQVERKGRREAKARRQVEQMVAAPERHRWEWVSSEETGDRGCKEWRVVPRYGPVGAAMGWWRIKVSGGCPLAARPAAACTSRSAADGQNRRR